MSSSIRSLLAIGLVALCGCGEPQADSADQTEIDGGHFDVNPSRFHWVEIDEAEFRILGVAPPFRIGKSVSPDHDAYFLVERLQASADGVHAAISERFENAHPGEELPIPKPRVRIVPAKEPNAWAAGVPVCLNIPLKIDLGDPARPPSHKPKIVLLPDEVKDNFPGRLIAQGPERCATAPWSAELEEFVEFFNAQGGACKVELSGGALHVSGARCRYNGTRTHSDTTVVYATAPFISITSEMLAIVDNEAPIVSTLTHELGHYYQAHPATGFIGARYRYWYEQSEVPSAARPTRTDDSSELTDKLQDLAGYPIPSVPGQHYSPRISEFLLSAVGWKLIPAACGDSCACSSAIAGLAHEWTNEFSCLACAFVSKQAETKFLAFEAALRECAADMVVAENAGEGVISLADFRQQLKDQGLKKFEPPSYPASASLGELLDLVNGAARDLDDAEAALMAEIEERHLGLYTIEQEADDFSLEYFAEIGNEPAARVTSALTLTRYQWERDPHAFMASNDVEYPELKRLYDGQWRDEGRYVFIPLGTIHDDHHGMTYRVFNFSRELTGHDYRAVGAPLGPMSVPWSEVQTVAAALRSEVPPPLPMFHQPGQGDSTSPIIVDPL